MPEKTNRYLDVVALLLAAAVGVVTYFICRNVLGHISHVPDETSYLFQGRIFASGHFWLTPPSVPDGFAVDHILIKESRWISMYPPGWPALLSVGWLFGNPWIINPIITALSALGIWRIGAVVFTKNTARLACALFCVSPFVLLMGSGQMSHMAALCAAVWSIAELFAAFKSDQKKKYVIAGLFAGIAFLIRPFSSSLLLIPAFLWNFKRNPRLGFCSLAGFLPFAVLYLIYNSYTFGDPFFAGYRKESSWEPLSFSVQFFFKNFLWYFRMLNGSLWRLPWPDLIILLPFIFLKRKTEFDWLLIACTLGLIAGYSVFSYADIVYSGPRYVFEMIGFLCVIAARSLTSAVERIRNIPIRFLILLPLLILPFRALPEQLSHHFMIYHGQSSRFIQMLEEAPVGENALILLAGDPFILRTFFFLNSLNPSKGDRIFLRDLSKKRREILKAYPRKEVWKITIILDPLPTQNPYVDRWRLRQASIVPLSKLELQHEYTK